MIYNDQIAAYKVLINQLVGSKVSLDSIDPTDVVNIGLQLADLLNPILNKINDFGITGGVVPPSDLNGQDLDLYIQGGSMLKFWRKRSGTWVNETSVSLGVNIIDGAITVNVSVDDMTVTVSPGSWAINNVIYSKATQTQIDLTAAHATLDRIDTIFADNTTNIGVIDGNPAADPEPYGIFDDAIILSYIYVPSIASGNLPYVVGNNPPASSGLWNLYSAIAAAPVTAILALGEDGKYHPTDVATIVDFLGIDSAAFFPAEHFALAGSGGGGGGSDTLQDVTDRGATTTHPIVITNNVDNNLIFESTSSGATVKYSQLRNGTANPLILNGGSGGNVGIGMLTPTEKLEVNGNVKATLFKGLADAATSWGGATALFTSGLGETLSSLIGFTNEGVSKGMSASLVKTFLFITNVDNTSDANKPVSTAQASALALKANIASPTFTGTPAAPTATVGTNTTQLATTAFVNAAMAAGYVDLTTVQNIGGAKTFTDQSKWIASGLTGYSGVMTSTAVIFEKSTGSPQLGIYGLDELSYFKDGFYQHFIPAATLTDERTIEMPDKSGKMALLDDVRPFFTNIGATTTQTSATLNTAYPGAVVGTMISMPNVGTGMMYVKKTASSGGEWAAWSTTNI